MAKVAFIVNRKIASIPALLQEVEDLFGRHHLHKVFLTERAGHSMTLAQEAIKEGFTQIISVGGDGSLNEVVNGVMNAKATLDPEEWAAIRVGVLPRGTGNDFVKTLGLVPDLNNLLRAIEQDKHRLIDLGLVEYQSPTHDRAQRYFINITDLGIGGVVAEKLESSPRWMGKMLTYQWAILHTFFRYRHKEIEVKSDSFQYSGKIMALVLANGQFFGSGLCIAPDAKLEDGQFSVVVIGEISMLDYLRNLGNLRASRRISHPEVTYHSANTVEVSSPTGRLPIDMDGEFIGSSPLQARIQPSAIRFIG
ncbi:MAG: diacylglycerol kinase family lipid kinase [Bacteroidia bacterium]|nr:diacylglycerol kinase family lipid kinase [Bacteroidia bacterium]